MDKKGCERVCTVDGANTAKLQCSVGRGCNGVMDKGTWEGTGITWKQKEDSLIQARTSCNGADDRYRAN